MRCAVLHAVRSCHGSAHLMQGVSARMDRSFSSPSSSQDGCTRSPADATSGGKAARQGRWQQGEEQNRQQRRASHLPVQPPGFLMAASPPGAQWSIATCATAPAAHPPCRPAKSQAGSCLSSLTPCPSSATLAPAHLPPPRSPASGGRCRSAAPASPPAPAAPCRPPPAGSRSAPAPAGQRVDGG